MGDCTGRYAAHHTVILRCNTFSESVAFTPMYYRSMVEVGRPHVKCAVWLHFTLLGACKLTSPAV